LPTEEFHERQLRMQPRAGRLSRDVSDLERGQRQRVERDRLLAEDAVSSARRHGIAVIEVDGSRDAAAIATLVAEHFRAHLPAPEPTPGER
jgi:hypothetical protein